MAASPKEKFDAAVAVIETLPKNGNFIPSHTLLLQFYGYYKQATLGPCNIPKPAFWDVIGKAKWGAWNKLGQMDKEEAMLAYVDELKKVLNQQYPQGYNKEEIVEAMPHTETVQNFVQKLGNFYEIVDPPPTESVDPNKGQGDGSGDSGQGSLPGTPQRSSGANSEDDTSHDPNNSSKDTLEDSEQELDRDELLIRTIKHDQTDAISHDQQYQNGYPIEINSIDINGKSPATINGNMGTMPTGPEMVALNGGPGHLDLLENSSESEGEEFCDTSDAPLIQEKLTENSAQSRVSQARVSSLTNAQSSNSVGLRPSGSSSQFLMSDPGQMMDRNWSSTNVTLTPNQSMSDMLTMRGGGETSTGNPPGMHTDGGNPQGLPAQGRGAVPRRAHSGASRQHLMSAVGGSGGRDNEGSSGSPSQQFPDLNEQIAVALIRLQQDMNSVLTRLNTLEGLTVAQRDRDRETSASGQRATGRSVWWWPFSGVRGRTIFFMLVWPFIVHWIITFLSRRRNRRR